MKHLILRAIAMPPMLFWVPYKMTVLNVALFAVCFTFGTGVFELNPVFFFAMLFAGHTFLAGAAAREPHLDTLIEAWIFKQQKTKNLVKTKGNKFIP